MSLLQGEIVVGTVSRHRRRRPLGQAGSYYYSTRAISLSDTRDRYSKQAEYIMVRI